MSVVSPINSQVASPPDDDSTTIPSIVIQHVNSNKHASTSTITTTTTAPEITGSLSTVAPLHDNLSVSSISTVTPITSQHSGDDLNPHIQTTLNIGNDENITEVVTEFLDTTSSIEGIDITSIEGSSYETSTTTVNDSEPLNENTSLRTTIDSYQTTTESRITITSSTTNTTSGILSIKNESIDTPPELSDSIIRNHTKDESISMKPSNANPAEIQHDYPIYVYGHEEVKIIKLKDDIDASKTHPVSTRDNDNLSEELTDSNLSAKTDNTRYDNADLKRLTPNSVHNKHESFVLNNNTNTSGADFQQITKSPNIKTIELPPIFPTKPTNTKRVLINVTIATDPGSSNPNAAQNVYVLSVSVPTDDDPKQEANVLGAESYMQPSALTKLENSHMIIKESPPTTKKPYEYWGGECQCNCPCLDNKDDTYDLTAKEASADYLDVYDNSSMIEDSLIKSNNTKIIEITSNNNSLYTTEDPMDTLSTTTEDVTSSVTETPCQDFSTKLPPPPTILILEGRSASVY